MKSRSCAVKEWSLNDEQRVLVEANLKLIDYTLNRYQWYSPCDTRDDLWQIGAMGLCRAAHDYEAGQQVNFSTFAVICIRTAIAHHITLLHYAKRDVRLEAKSLDQTLDMDSDVRLVDLLPDRRANVEKVVVDCIYRHDLDTDLAKVRLTPREREVLNMRFREGLNFGQIAQRVGLTRSRIGQVYQTVLYKLRMQLPDAYRDQLV